MQQIRTFKKGKKREGRAIIKKWFMDRRSNLCFCRRICSRAFISTLSKCVTAITQCFTLSFVGNSGGNNEPHRTDSIDSGLHQINKTTRWHYLRLTLEHHRSQSAITHNSPIQYVCMNKKRNWFPWGMLDVDASQDANTSINRNFPHDSVCSQNTLISICFQRLSHVNRKDKIPNTINQISREVKNYKRQKILHK